MLRGCFAAWWLAALLAGCTLEHPDVYDDGSVGDGVDTDAPPCGGDGQPCCAGQRCAAGTTCTAENRCVGGCPAGQRTCAGTCVDPQSDPRHCGGCGQPCAPAHGSGTCAAGRCAVTSCDAGFADCNGLASDGCEVDTNTSASHCGSCGVACTAINAAGVCVAGSCGLGACEPNYQNCNGQEADGCEVDTRVSAMNCGACGNVCAVPGAMASECDNGTCVASTCGPGRGNCDSNRANGCEADLGSNPAHCGGCGNSCARPHASTECRAGLCAVTGCEAGYGDCDMNAANGCETNLAVTPGHCGACGRACMLSNATAGCAASTCTVLSCAAGYGNCDGMSANGCETNLNTNAGNCGGCGMRCSFPGASATCAGGTCRLAACNAGRGDCDRMASNGCETDLNTTASSCGGCGSRCMLANASPSCTGGSCVVATCATGYGNCDGANGNGCEVTLATNENHCGRCGNMCRFTNAMATCAGGSCRIGACTGGFGNCDSNPSNGCEVNTSESLAHCGGCDRPCRLMNATPVCNRGSCEVASCATGFADCDRTDGNGCEVDTRSSTNNCGACGRVCTNAHGTTRCTGASCAPTCMPGWGDCDGDATNGCEAPLNTMANCGACRTACNVANGAGSCASGSCAVTSCNTGFADCNMRSSDGCEVNTNTSAMHCDRCGTPCPTSAPNCRNGVCEP